MTRATLFVVTSLCTALLMPAVGCSKKDKGTDNPDAAEGDVDPLVELQGIPDLIQAEIDLVLQPINDVDVVVDQVTTMPTRLGVDAAALTGLAKASLDGGSVAVDLDVDVEVKAEIETLLETVTGIAVGLKETPERAKQAGVNIAELGVKGAGLVAKLTAKLNAKLANPMLKGDAKLKVEADLAMVVQINGDIQAQVADAKATVTGLPATGATALAKLTAAFAGGASAG